MHYYTREDYSSRYRSTYVGIRDEGLVKPFYVHGVDGGGRDIHFVGYVLQPDGTRGAVKTINVRDEALILHPPKLGMVQNGGELFYIQRRPLRRWKQGLTLDSCNTRWYVRSADSEERGTNVYKVFNPDRTPIEEALQQVFEVPRRGYSITKAIGIVPSLDANVAHVVHKMRKVGEYMRDAGSLQLLHGCQPLVDTMRRAGFNNTEVRDA